MRNLLIALISILLGCSIGLGQSAPAIQADPNAKLPQIPLPSPSGEEKLRIFSGRSMVVRSPEPLKRISVTDPAIASAIVVSPTQLMIHGIKPGTVTLLLWDEQERLRSFDLQVQIDFRSLSTSLKQIYPTEQISVSQSGSAAILTGEVSSPSVAEKIVALAQTQTPSVVNMLRSRTATKNTIMLQVRFAEVDRSAVQQLGVNVFSTGAGNTLGSITTQQFGSLSANVGAVPAEVTRGKDPDAPNLASGGIGNVLKGTPGVFGLSDLLNIFVFRPDVNLGLVIKALQQRNLLQMLAEPNLLAANGQEASFLAGGEFPFPVVQGGAGYNAVTIQFKEFGIKLKFLANIFDDGQIRLKVAPEVSSLDYSNALTISGFLVPALSTRKADTEVELRDGQSFAIAGLIDNRLAKIASKVPWLGDIPILGHLFKSKSINRNKTELLVVVTPVIVKPLDPNQTAPVPGFPIPFWENSRYDGNQAGEAPISKKGNQK